MLRFILNRRSYDAHINFETQDYVTVDIDVPTLESFLCRGGSGPSGFERFDLSGVEVLGEIDGTV